MINLIDPPTTARIWTSKDGRKTPVTEMRDGHLANAIAFVRRRYEARVHEYREALRDFEDVLQYVADGPPREREEARRPKKPKLPEKLDWLEAEQARRTMERLGFDRFGDVADFVTPPAGYKPKDIMIDDDIDVEVANANLTDARSPFYKNVSKPMIKITNATELQAAYDAGRRDFRGIDLSGVYLARANFAGANFAGVYLYGANLYGANLYGANFTRANLAEVYLYGANLYGANLYGANLYGANLNDANLTRADLSGANLTRADFTRADLSGACLTRADLTRADLTDANFAGAEGVDLT